MDVVEKMNRSLNDHEVLLGGLNGDVALKVLRKILDEAHLSTIQGGGINYNHMVSLLKREVNGLPNATLPNVTLPRSEHSG